MSIESDYHDFMQKMYEWQVKKSGKKPGDSVRISERTVRYVAPGHTIVYYKNRTLHVYFKESKAEFQKKAKLRRKHAAIDGQPRKVDDTIYVDRDQYGNMIYVTASGKEITQRAKKTSEKGRNAAIRKGLKKDEYTVEDMRAILNDDHWDEVCGHRRWNYDRVSTVREFNKYLKRKR
jgi:hypothetical protein